MNATVINIPIRDEQHWHDLRRDHVGGSEVAALFGEHAQMTKWELWQIKAGRLPAPDLSGNERVLWGSLIEPAIAQGVTALQGWTVRKVRRYLSSGMVNGFGGTPDYEIVSNERGRGILEIKTADRLIFRDWGDEPPLGYLLQLQSYMDLAGATWGAIAVLVGGNDLKIFTYDYRPVTASKIRAAVADFWKSIKDRQEPAINFERDGKGLAKLYERSDGQAHDLTGNNRLPELLAAYKAGSALEKQGAAAKDAAKAEILSIIEDREVCTVAGWKITAKTVGETPISFVRKPYRTFTVTAPKEPKNVERNQDAA
jgi:predicted phage-related endonuclease